LYNKEANKEAGPTTPHHDDHMLMMIVVVLWRRRRLAFFITYLWSEKNNSRFAIGSGGPTHNNLAVYQKR